MFSIVQRPIIERDHIGDKWVCTGSPPAPPRQVKFLPASEILELINSKDTVKEWRERFIKELSFRVFGIDRTQLYTGIKSHSTIQKQEEETVPLYMIEELRLLNILTLINNDEHNNIAFDSNWHKLLMRENEIRNKRGLKEGYLGLIGFSLEYAQEENTNM